MITEEKLKETLDYNHENGVFTWKVANSNRVKVGDIAGSLNKITRYQEIGYQGKLQYAHRLAWLYMYGEFPDKFIDHINGDRSNNCISNLRVCSNGENMRNTGISKNNTSGFKGVSWCKRRCKWEANAALNGKKKFLGYFLTEQEASAVYQEFASANHGGFYRDTTK